MTLTDTILSNPILLAGLAVAIRAVVATQRGLSWPEYRTLHGIKRLVAPRLDRHLSGAGLVNPKGYRDDAEFEYTDWDTVSGVARYLHNAAGGSYHLINSLKRRELPNGTVQYSAAHLVWLHEDGTQTEVYLFRAPDDGTDVYAHHETAVTNPDGHLENTQQVDGDPRGVVTARIEKGGSDG